MRTLPSQIYSDLQFSSLVNAHESHTLYEMSKVQQKILAKKGYKLKKQQNLNSIP